VTDKGLVSVVLIFKDEERFIREAISSVLSQTYGRWEMLLVDDGSSDRSTSIARECAAHHDGQIRYLEHAGHANCGMSASRNLGIRESRGELVAFLDGDDVWLPDHLKVAVDILEEFSKADMVYGRSLYWYSWEGEAASQPDRLQSHWFRAKGIVEAPDLLRRFLTFRASLPSPTGIVVRTHAVREVGGFVDAFRGMYEDQAFLARFCLSRAVYVSQRCTTLYRQHASATSALAERFGRTETARSRYYDWLESILEKAGECGSELRQAARLARQLGDRNRADWGTRLALTRVKLRQHAYAALERLSDIVRLRPGFRQ
jgi:glycosyltransferase involved in cell wall biosynthesis